MKKKNIVFATLLSLCMMTSIVHASENDAGITYAGDAENFIKTTDETVAFNDMMPGEERTQSIVLTNENYDSMKFFVKVDEAVLLNEEENGNIAYDITFSNDGTAFYSGKIGGKSKAAKNNINEEYLLKTLSKGESTQVEMTIKIDATSMTNDYQGSNGNLDIIFSVEHADNNKVVEVVKNIPIINQIPGVNTGDTTSIYLILTVFLIALALIIMIIIKRRKDDKDETK